ncbi:MAG: gliding motility-associated C-terminal domain-containing protein [Bacteroidetes bacterium]|nr:gliding motility-associated C-terminal domain-containing protein [Bacteroidota bacterium]
MKKLFLSTVLATTICSALHAQLPVLNYVFSPDSLTGFDEKRANDDALHNHFFGNEYKSYMYKARREYINHRFHLAHQDVPVFGKAAATTTNVIQPACTNIDFEAGSLFGWTHTSGSNSNSSTMAGCCPTAGGIASVINGTGTDPLVSAVSLVSPLGGSKIVQLNDNNPDYSVQRISQTFSVTPSNAIFQFAYAGILEDAGHACTDQPYMNVSVIDSAGNTLPCPYIPIAAPSSLCSQSASVTAGWIQNTSAGVYYHTWTVKTLDLSPYIGSYVTIQITVGDCTQGGHYGYGYFDCACYPMQVGLNGTLYDATPLIPINVSTCGAMSATITAPYGVGPYNWDGPAGSGITAATGSVITTTTPGQYTLTMSPTGTCLGPIVKLLNLFVTPNPTASNVTAQPTCTNAVGSATINASSGTPPFTYSWTPAAGTGSVSSGLSPGTNYTVTVSDNVGCSTTTTLSINTFTDAPNYSITSSPGLLLNCNTQTITLNGTPTSTYTSISWTGPAGAIPGNTVSVTSPGTYTFVATNTISTCVATITLNITSDTAAPQATFTKICNTSTIVLTGVPTSPANAYLGWVSPTGNPIGNPAQAPAVGTYSLIVTNPVNGCKTTYTTNVIAPGAPNASSSATPGSSLTCVTHTVQLTAASTTSNTIFTWQIPGTPTSTTSTNPLPVTSAGTYTAIVTNTLTGCMATTTISVVTNTTAPLITITAPGTVIPCSTNSLSLSGNSNVGGTTYTWTSGPTSQTYNVSAAGNYTVTGTSPVNGCTATATYAVSHETITASFTANPTHGLMPLDVNFINNSNNALSYLWDFDNGSTSTSTNPSTNYPVQGTYTVVLTATNGYCVDMDTVVITVDLVSFLTIPNVFTPNGDGVNDVFKLGTVNMGEIHMIVYDRWGLKMFEATENGNMNWDGKNKGGNTVSDGTYFYVIKATGLDAQKYDLKGTINVFK